MSLRLRPGPDSGEREREVSPVHVSGTQRGTLRHPGDIKLEDGVMSHCPPFIFDNIPFSRKKAAHLI